VLIVLGPIIFAISGTGSLLAAVLWAIGAVIITVWYEVYVTKVHEEGKKERRRFEKSRREYEKREQQKRIEEGLKSLGSYGKNEEISGNDFERIVAKIFSKRGYSVSTTKGSGDEGIDLYMRDKEDEKIGVQCKKWKGIVGQHIIRDFYGSLMHAHLKKGFVVTTGRFSEAAKDFARSEPIFLIDGKKLREIIEKTL